MEEQITISRLIIETAKMRHAQKEFFATRSGSALQQAREHEKKVDSLLKSFVIQGNHVIFQPTLF